MGGCGPLFRNGRINSVKCIVTGATGFVGRHLCRQLLSRGDEVLALSAGGAPLEDGTPTHPIDLATQLLPDTLLDGVESVFHLAAIAHRNAPPEHYERLNHQATVSLARQAASAGVRCFIFMSSVRAMGEARSVQRRGEADCSPPTDPYGLSKWRAECALRNAFGAGPATSGAMSVVLLRPCLIYGSGVKGNLRSLARAVQLGLPRPPDGGRRSMIAVQDLAALMCVLADAPPPGLHTWIAAAEDHSTQEIVDALRAALGRGRGRVLLPRWAWRAAARLLDMARQNQGQNSYNALFGNELYDNSALLAASAWRPEHRFAQSAANLLRGGA